MILTKNKKSRRFWILTLGVLLLIYAAGYAFCRQNHFIVHISACAAGAYSFHDVIDGDAKFAGFNPLFAAFYTPLRYFEKAYWYIAKPDGSPCAESVAKT